MLEAALIRGYLFTFYPSDHSADMFDLKHRRYFMKRMGVPGVAVKELFVGSTITVHSR